MKKSNGSPVGEVSKAKRMLKGYSDTYFKDLSTEYQGTSIKIKKSGKKTTEDKIVDYFIEGDCPDTISEKLGIKYSEVEKTLNEFGMV